MKTLHLIRGLFSIALCSLLLPGCEAPETDMFPQNGQPIFELLRKDVTGLDFENVLKQSLEFNALNYAYYFNGGGLAADDFNNDGLIDLYFTSNMGPNKLFLNEGGLQFKDVTKQADAAGQQGAWSSGVTVVDINNDGLLDIYLNQVGDFQILKGRNQLLICKGISEGIPFYEDEAAQYGLDLVCFGTHAAFFDYDLDGDLDLFQLNHSLHSNNTYGQRKEFENKQHPKSGDRLFRNDVPAQPGQSGKSERIFVDVTASSGINSTVIGYGLGVVVGDVNLDGWPDLYIGNDFHENDYLYINQQDGTFKEARQEQIMHTSNFSMGVDMADINNDGWNEIISLDMMPEDPFILKTSKGDLDYSTYHFRIRYGYDHQFARNNLQLNNGNGTFSEIGMFAGIHATDWSWAPLFMDFDHDGLKDLFISNGIPRRMNDIDYINYRQSDENFQFRTNNSIMIEENLDVIERMPRIKLPNKFYRNTGQLTFDDLSHQIKAVAPTYSSGSIYADLDLDGDLDVVVNNNEDEPFVYKNLTIENGNQKGSYLSLSLQGPPNNRNAIGAKAVVFQKNDRLVYENFPVRGFQSCLPARLHFGVGETTSIDSVIVVWPDGTYHRIRGPKYNQVMEVAWQSNFPRFDYQKFQYKKEYLVDFEDVTAQTGINFTHEENQFLEFHREQLMLHMVSWEGPALAVGDVNGDGLEDVFFGSSKRKQSQLYLQQQDGQFTLSPTIAIENDSLFEDVDASFADLDNDGDLDLVIAAGGNEYNGEHEAMQQRAYLNDGTGNFQKINFAGIYMTASCVLPADYNGDGLVDLFFGGRAVPWNYGITPKSVLLQNLGNGNFKNVTETVCNDLQEVGLVKNGSWYDIDRDGDEDLLLAIEWGPITAFLNDGGQFKKKRISDHSGWWNFILPHDFDGDGDIDLLAGNVGKNSKLRPTKEHPLKIYINDFDNNDQVEQIVTYNLDGREQPFNNFEEITAQLVGLKKKYLLSKDFANASLKELFGKQALEEAIFREANTFQSMYFENKGALQFAAHDLPDELQFSTIQDASLFDLNQDGRTEVILGGNFYQCNTQLGRYDASYGHVLSIGENGEMKVFPLGQLAVKNEVRRIQPIKLGKDTFFIFVKNNQPAQVLRPLL
ncbi:MAG: VCBS repeat-containing protein [Bacteroidota bacterium]